MTREWKIETIEVIKSDVFRFLDNAREKFDVIFAGPPYALENIDDLPEKVFGGKILEPGGWFILETNPKYSFDTHPAFFRKTNYGQTTFHFFRQKHVSSDS